MKAIVVVAFMLALVGCSEPKKPLTKEQQWQGYCKSFGYAARAIMHDRQNGIEREKAIEHANQIEDETIKSMILGQIELAYQQEKVAGKANQQELITPFMQAAEKKCLNTPYTEIPDFKPL